MNVEPARPSDVAAMCDLLAQLFAQEAEFRPDRERQAAGLGMILADPALGRILVLRDGPDLAGMVSILFTVSTALGGRVAVVEDMVVRPERRGLGAGSILLAAALESAEACGCLRATLLTDRDNHAAQRFYRGHGFAASEMLPMRLSLEGRPPGIMSDSRSPAS